MKNKKNILIIIFFIILLILLEIIYKIYTSNKKYYINEKNLQIPIYTYHDIVTNEEQVNEDYMQTTFKKLKEQINGLLQIGCKPINYEILLNYKNGQAEIYKNSFIITFDDGYKSIYEYVYPFIKEKDIPITIFVIDSCVGGENYLTWDELKEMHDSGLVSVYSHGLNHIEYNKLDSQEILNEINESYSNLKINLQDENILKVFAYPYGLCSEESVNILEENGYIQNLMDGKINKSNELDLGQLHRAYPLNDSVIKIKIKQLYKSFKY